MATENIGDVILKEVRLQHPALFTAVEFKQGDGKPRWSANFHVAPGSANDKAIRAAIQAVAQAEWGNSAAKMLASFEGQKTQHCYLNGAAKGFPDVMILAAHRYAKLKSGTANSRPAIIDRDKSPLTDQDGKPYGGCYVNAKVQIWAQKGENPGIRCGFSVVQFVKDGEAFGSGAPNVDEFEDLGAGADADAMV